MYFEMQHWLLTHQEVELAQKVNFLSEIKGNSQVISLIVFFFFLNSIYFNESMQCPEFYCTRKTFGNVARRSIIISRKINDISKCLSTSGSHQE